LSIENNNRKGRYCSSTSIAQLSSQPVTYVKQSRTSGYLSIIKIRCRRQRVPVAARQLKHLWEFPGLKQPQKAWARRLVVIGWAGQRLRRGCEPPYWPSVNNYLSWKA